MMVRDEEKNLRRCLDAVKSLVDRDDVELIIVDTGSKDSTVDIAREYTDKVYFHPWNNNFAAMRNVTVSYARGEYILIMDADEVLTDPASLYKYISDESLKDYNTFTVKVKNFPILQEDIRSSPRRGSLKMTGHSDTKVPCITSRNSKNPCCTRIYTWTITAICSTTGNSGKRSSSGRPGYSKKNWRKIRTAYIIGSSLHEVTVRIVTKRKLLRRSARHIS